MCVGRLKLRLNYFSSGTRICTFMAHTLLWIALAEQESHWFVPGPDGRLPAACLLILYQLFTAAVSRILRYCLGVRIWQISLIFVCFECVKYSSVVHHCSLCTVSGGLLTNHTPSSAPAVFWGASSTVSARGSQEVLSATPKPCARFPCPEPERCASLAPAKANGRGTSSRNKGLFSLLIIL